ncbi:Imm7 family immunity protein [Streptomyces sp. NBC_00233]|uniref:Imm7 family immunity protein n=1 Tax=Streptomyces sp. NBC_00233 TaxID=2975686 RepID=UPI002257FF3E|nr:Imm7 family immunity protein [Streptomyces sp. NBC_00233]MCX5231517.1 immunity 7 family protein [Streptomyces sp. NBC_00233]
MFEYHGWITIHDSPGDDDETRLAVIVESLRHRIEAIDSPYLLDLRWMNGEAVVHLGGFSNHASPEIADFFRHVGSVAPGSYGLLHVRDDEDPRHGNEYENAVRVLRMARGDVTEHTEALLSPCIPTIEDEVE